MLAKKQAQGMLLGLRQYIDAVLEFLKDDTLTPDAAVSKVTTKAAELLESAATKSANQEQAPL
jgi:hypothetical protein